MTRWLLLLAVLLGGCDDSGDVGGFWLVELDAERVAASADGHAVVGGSGCGVQKLHRDSGESLWSEPELCAAAVAVDEEGEIYALAELPVGGLLLARLDADTGEQSWAQAVGTGTIERHAIAADGIGRVATLHCGVVTGSVTRVCTVSVYETSGGARLWTTLPVAGPVTDVRFNSDGDLLVAHGGTTDGLLLLDGNTAATIWQITLPGGGDPVDGGGVLAADDEAHAFVGGACMPSSDGPPQLHRVDGDGTVAWSVPVEVLRDAVTAVAALPDLAAVAVAGTASAGVLTDAGGALLLVDVQDGSVRREVSLGLPVLGLASEPGNRVYVALGSQLMALQW